MLTNKYEQYRKYANYVKKYRQESNAATASEVDANANVDSKNIATCDSEIAKREKIGYNRLMMIDKITEMWGADVAEEYIRQIESHEIYKHDETSIYPYTYSAKETIIVKVNEEILLVSFEDLYELCDAPEYLADPEKNVWCKYPNKGMILILDKNGWTNVSRLVKKQRHRNLVRVKTAFGEDLIVTDNHPLIVEDNVEKTVDADKSKGLSQYRVNIGNYVSFGDTEELNMAKLSPYNIYQYDTFYDSQTDAGCVHSYVKSLFSMNREMGYFIGFFIGDGNYIKNEKGFTDTIAITQKQPDVLKKIAQIIWDNTGIGSRIIFVPDKQNCWRLLIKSADIVFMLSEVLGIKHYAQNKTLPKNIFSFSKEFATGIIEGLIDSDGTVGENGMCSVRLASRTAILQLSTICHVLGISGGNIIQNLPFSNNSSYNTNYTIFGYQFRLTKNTQEALSCSTKVSKCDIVSNNSSKYSTETWATITDVKEIEEGTFLDENGYIYDITTDTHSFVCNGLWAHNCVSITMYPFLFYGLKSLGGKSGAPKHLDSFCGEFINLVFAIAAQFAGAVSTPEFLMYMDYFIRKDYGNDYTAHWDEIISPVIATEQKTLGQLVEDKFQQVVHSINQPAAARGYQAVFWNIAYFDEPYFKGMFDNFVFPDGSEPNWGTVSFLQKRFMKWFNKERLSYELTFPVETLNLLNDGKEYVDKEWADFGAEMYSEGHSFFTYTSDSVDSLASCCFDGKQMCLTKSSDGVNYMTFEEFYNAPYSIKRNLTIFHNGNWVKGKIIRLESKGHQMYEIITANNKRMVVTDNHLFPTFNGDKRADTLTTDDYLMFSTKALNAPHEVDKHLTYNQGFLIGMYLGDGSMNDEEYESHTTTINLSLNEEKYTVALDKIQNAVGKDVKINLGKLYNNVYPVTIRDNNIASFIRSYVSGKYCFEKSLNMDCLLQSVEFRQGILDGYYLTDGGNSNRIYSTSKELIDNIETLCVSLGYSTIIDVSDRMGDNEVVIRGESFNRNYPVYCIRWYETYKRKQKDVHRWLNNSLFFKIKSITPIEYNDEYVSCFEMDDKDEPYFTLPNGVITHNCRLKNEVQDNTFSYTLGAGGVSTGSKGVMTININRLVQNAKRDGIDISEAVRTQVKKIHKYLLAFNEIVKDNFKANLLTAYNAGYISLDKQYLTIGINGFVEGAEFLGIDISPNEQYFAYGESILKPIYEENRKARTSEVMFNTEFIPGENLGIKNAKWDKKDGYIVPRDCYNSYFYKVEDESCNLIDKFILHGKRLTKYLDGGSALHANLEEHLSKPQYNKVMEIAINTGCSYFTFNIPNTVCNDCGFITKHNLPKCPKCGSDNVDYLTRIIGYLKRVSKWSEARQKEAKTRYYDNNVNV